MTVGISTPFVLITMTALLHHRLFHIVTQAQVLSHPPQSRNHLHLFDPLPLLVPLLTSSLRYPQSPDRSRGSPSHVQVPNRHTTAAEPRTIRTNPGTSPRNTRPSLRQPHEVPVPISFRFRLRSRFHFSCHFPCVGLPSLLVTSRSYGCQRQRQMLIPALDTHPPSLSKADSPPTCRRTSQCLSPEA